MKNNNINISELLQKDNSKITYLDNLTPNGSFKVNVKKLKDSQAIDYSVVDKDGSTKLTEVKVLQKNIDDAIIIVDECQSMTWHELSSVITRVGHRSKIIFVNLSF